MDYNIDIHYIYNSGFFVETKSCWLIFDYYIAKRYMNNQDFDYTELEQRMLSSNKPVYVFTSHSHFDHFNERIFSWNDDNRYIQYILSDYIHIPNQLPNYHFVRENSSLSFNGINITCFGSTDEGVSFMVEVDDTVIFHAGDLNWWDWGKEDTEDESEAMEKEFKRIIKDIKSTNKHIDIMFFPLDKRLEERYSKGANYVLDKLSPSILVPMHFRKKTSVIEEYKDEAKKHCENTKILTIQHENSSFRV